MISNSRFGYVWSRKHWIAWGNHSRLFRVKHRHVTKGVPRAHLGRFWADYLGRIKNSWCIRLSRVAHCEEFAADVIGTIEFVTLSHGSKFS